MLVEQVTTLEGAVLAGSQIRIREQAERRTRCRGLKLVPKVIS